jgi:hypothetical protein
MDAGLPLSETWLRVPVCSLRGSPRSSSCHWPCVAASADRAAAVFAFLLAISPLLVLYSRIIRSYAPATLAAFGAVLCFEVWWRTRRRSAGAGYGVFAALAIWLNLTTLPFVAAPIVYTTARIALNSRARPSELAALAGVGAFALLCVAAVLLPAASSLVWMSGMHGKASLPTAEAWFDVARMHAGTRSPWVAAGIIAALARGAVLLWQRDREFLLYVASIAALHGVGLVLLGPSQLDNPIVINRYLIVLLPFGLALCALGLSAPLPRLPTALQWGGHRAAAAGHRGNRPLRRSELRADELRARSDLGLLRSRRELAATRVRPALLPRTRGDGGGRPRHHRVSVAQPGLE